MFDRDPTTATIGVEILPLELGYLPEFFQKKGEIEINYSQSVREKTLRELKEAIAGEDSLNGASFTDEALLTYLSSRKYDVAKTLAQVKKCIAFKGKYSTIFDLPSFDVYSAFLTSEMTTLLPWRCQDGCVVIILQLDRFSSKLHPLQAIKQFFTFLLIQCLREPMTQINGFKIIFDLSVNLDVLKVCTPENLYLLYYGSQEILPGRFKSFHLVNMRASGRAVWHLIRIFMSKKLRERVLVHATSESLLNFFPKAILPTKYGGDLKDYVMTEWLRKVSSPEGMKWLSNLY